MHLPQQRKRLCSKILSHMIINIQSVADSISQRVIVSLYQCNKYGTETVQVTLLRRTLASSP